MNELFVAEIVSNNQTRFSFLVCDSKKQAYQLMEHVCKVHSIPYTSIDVTGHKETLTHQIVIGSPEDSIVEQEETLYFVRFDDLENANRFLAMVVGTTEEDVLLYLYKECPEMDFQKKHDIEIKPLKKVGDYPIQVKKKTEHPFILCYFDRNNPSDIQDIQKLLSEHDKFRF